VCYVGKVTSSDRSETSPFGNGATKVIFIAALPSRWISAITAMRAIPRTRESTRYWMMRFSANMTNDDHSVVPIEVKLDPQRFGAGLRLAISRQTCAHDGRRRSRSKASRTVSRPSMVAHGRRGCGHCGQRVHHAARRCYRVAARGARAAGGDVTRGIRTGKMRTPQ